MIEWPYVLMAIIVLLMMLGIIIYLGTELITLQRQYAVLKSRYENLTNILSQYLIQYYGRIMRPILYTYPSMNNSVAVYLIITNPTDKPMNVTMLYVFSRNPPPPQFWFSYPTRISIYIPPSMTIRVPLIIAFIDTQSRLIYWWGYPMPPPGSTSPAFPLNMVTLVVLNNTLINYGINVVLHLVMTKKSTDSLNNFGFAMYIPGTAQLRIDLINPSLTTITIINYSIYTYNRTLLTTCRLKSGITINAVSGISVNITTMTQAQSIIYEVELRPNGSWTTELPHYSVLCTPNYVFPMNTEQLPYGYVILNTNFGNITIPLLPQ
ncbi:MAG: hypothetical protein ACP5NQ_06720 [Vulcanisaeta sp.]